MSVPARYECRWHPMKPLHRKSFSGYVQWAETPQTRAIYSAELKLVIGPWDGLNGRLDKGHTYDNTASVCGQYACDVSFGRHIVRPGVLAEKAISNLDQRRNHQAHDEFTVGKRIESHRRRTGSKTD